MSKVFTHMTMSLDGYIAEPDDQIGELFEWYEAGDVTVPNPNEYVTFKVDEASARVLRDLTANVGALVVGRRLFDIADGKDVTIASANVAQQALTLGLVDEVCVSLVPVLFGEGIPYFANLGGHHLLEDPEVVQGRRALHLRYPVRR